MITRDTIEAYRVKLGWSYSKLAEAAGLNDDTVRMYLQKHIDTGSEKADALLKVVRDAEMEHKNE